MSTLNEDERGPEEGATASATPGQPRRSALLALATTSVALTVRAALAGSEEQAKKPPEANAVTAGSRKRRWGMVIDLDRCTGCGGCVVACQSENNVAPTGPEMSDKTRGIYWMDLLPMSKGTEYPDLSETVLPVPCMHCDDPPCVKVCPVGATYQTDEGITAQVWDRCIGCRYCQVACPYARRHFNWVEPSFPASARSQLNPDVALRPKGVVEKCTFCQHKIRAVTERARVDETELHDKDFQHLPACAQACPAKAITFGDLNDTSSEVSRLSKSPRAFRLLEELGTRPKVTYLRETKWQD